MIYITQLIYIQNGQEAVFDEYENLVLPMLERYNGKLLFRLRPKEDAYVVSPQTQPYEIHLVSFDSDPDFEAFKNDGVRQQYLHLKEQSIRSMLLIKGSEV